MSLSKSEGGRNYRCKKVIAIGQSTVYQNHANRRNSVSINSLSAFYLQNQIDTAKMTVALGDNSTRKRSTVTLLLSPFCDGPFVAPVQLLHKFPGHPADV